MDATLTTNTLMAEQDKRFADTFLRESGRLKNFIRQRVSDQGDAEDILQDVFFELMEAYRLPEPIEQVGAWLYRVARNRIIDRFRKKKEDPLPNLPEDDEGSWLDNVLPSPDAGAEAVYARNILLEEIIAALDQLPEDQRNAFIGNELEGRSFKEMAAESGVGVNTLLARKRYAVIYLRQRLQSIYSEFI